MTDEQDYKQNYLHFLSGYGFHRKQKRRAVPTAFVEFCDLGKPESSMETSREYHNHFKPSTVCLPKIQPRRVKEKDTPLNHIPEYSAIPLTNSKVPFTFTEGLSALSAPKPPLFPFQRSDVPIANLPNDVQLSEEKIRGLFDVERRIPQDDTPRRRTLATNHIPLMKRNGKLENGVLEIKPIEDRPFLKFAPNVIYHKRPQKDPVVLRSYTPHNPEKNKKLVVVPKEIGMNELSNLSIYRQKSFGNFYQKEISRLREKKSNNKLSVSCVLGVSCVSKTELELPFSVLREKMTSKSTYNKPFTKLDLKQSDSLFREDESETNTSVRFVIKMPRTVDMLQTEITEVALLNANNSNNRENSFDIEECPANSEIDNRGIIEAVDDTRLMSIEPQDVDEPCGTLNSDKRLSSSGFGDDILSQDPSFHNDTVLNDLPTELTCIEHMKGDNSFETLTIENCLDTICTELDQYSVERIDSKDTESEKPEQNSDGVPVDINLNVSKDQAKKKLRLEVIVLKTTTCYREVTTQMYYS